MNALVAFFLGQLSIALLIFAFIKFFIFGDAPPPAPRDRRLSSSSNTRTFLRPKRSLPALRSPPSAISTKTILSKSFYNVSNHQPESLDWFNVLIAQTIAQLRAEAAHDGAIVKTLADVLNGSWKPDWMGRIDVTEVALGDEFPIFSNCRIMPIYEGSGTAGASGRPGTSAGRGAAATAEQQDGERTRLQARLDVDLNDVITLGVETRLVLNYPKPVVAVLPVALAVSLVRFRATLSLSFIPATIPSSDSSSTGSPTMLEFSFLPDYDLELSTRSLVGSRSRLQDVPKIAQLVEARLHAWFDERCVEPRVQQIVLPSFWPRKKNTRGGDDAIDADDEVPNANGDVRRGQGEDIEAVHERDTIADIVYDSGLEARMTAEGKKLRDAFAENPMLAAGRQHDEGIRRRGHPPRGGSVEELRMPGRFE